MNKQGVEWAKIDNVIQSSAEGYAFPSNLDLDHPSADDVAPRTQASYLRQAVKEEWAVDKFQQELQALEQRRH